MTQPQAGHTVTPEYSTEDYEREIRLGNLPIIISALRLASHHAQLKEALREAREALDALYLTEDEQKKIIARIDAALASHTEGE